MRKIPSSNVSKLDQFLNPNIYIALPSRTGDLTGLLCNFEEFGTSMGMYINETTVMCVTPHI